MHRDRGASENKAPSVELGATMASCAPVMKHEGRWMEVAAAAADGFVSAAARVATGHLGTGTMWSQVPSEASYSRTGTRANACPRRPHDFLPCGSSLELELCLSRIACPELPVSNCLFARSLELLRLTPVAQQDCKVGRVDHAVVIEVGGASSALAP